MGTGRLIRFREEIFMRRGRVWYTAAITLVMMTGLFTITSFAAKGEKITAIKLEVKDNLQLGSALDEGSAGDRDKRRQLRRGGVGDR